MKGEKRNVIAGDERAFLNSREQYSVVMTCPLNYAPEATREFRTFCIVYSNLRLLYSYLLSYAISECIAVPPVVDAMRNIIYAIRKSPCVRQKGGMGT